ncbi:hypothetical protein AVEN_18670-1 [Araneus ventricosus]|uniref:Uncharacterized protein n=1 Tax=Araneus ventricosus TaxID=182803 RepID=A0A4Y2VYK6_ARAVE|nr:hypothetical protein AVEN_18670-1 [Araneus ventricosus]
MFDNFFLLSLPHYRFRRRIVIRSTSTFVPSSRMTCHGHHMFGLFRAIRSRHMSYTFRPAFALQSASYVLMFAAFSYLRFRRHICDQLKHYIVPTLTLAKAVQTDLPRSFH